MSEITSQNSIINNENFAISNAAKVTSVSSAINDELSAEDSNIVVSDVTFSRGTYFVVSGQIFDGVELSGSATLYVSGGTVDNMTVTPSYQSFDTGYVSIDSVVEDYRTSSATLDTVDYYNTVYIKDTTLFVSAGGIVSNVVISGARYIGQYNSSGYLTTGGWYPGNSTTLYTLPTMYVLSGGMAYNTTVYGNQYVSSGGLVTDAIIGTSGKQYVFDGGIVSGGTVSSGKQYVSSGAVVNSMVIEDGGVQYISSGGVANATVISGGAIQYVLDEGIANSTIIGNGGAQSVGLTASSLFVSIGPMVLNIYLVVMYLE